MATQTPEIKSTETRDVAAPESGVIDDARRHRRRERTVASLLVLALTGAVLFLINAGHGAQVSRASSPQPTRMTGLPLSGSTHLRLLVSQNGGRPWIVDIPSGREQRGGAELPGLKL